MLYLGFRWSGNVRVAPAIFLTDEQKAELTRLSRSGRTSVRLAQRARIVLLAAQGLQNKDCARRPNFDHPRRLNIDQGWKPVSIEAGCG
jgi:hypothetical protein